MSLRFERVLLVFSFQEFLVFTRPDPVICTCIFRLDGDDVKSIARIPAWNLGQNVEATEG